MNTTETKTIDLKEIRESKVSAEDVLRQIGIESIEGIEVKYVVDRVGYTSRYEAKGIRFQFNNVDYKTVWRQVRSNDGVVLVDKVKSAYAKIVELYEADQEAKKIKRQKAKESANAYTTAKQQWESLGHDKVFDCEYFGKTYVQSELKHTATVEIKVDRLNPQQAHELQKLIYEYLANTGSSSAGNGVE